MRVLFVEDDPMNRRVVRDMLTVVGVNMSEAPEALTGLKMIDENEYDLVLMDLRMPGMDGLEAIRVIRGRDDAKAGWPIIVVTADTAIDIVDQCHGAGADDVMQKPVAMKALFDIIALTLAKRAPKAAMIA